MNSTTLDLALWAGAVVLAALAVGLLAWALFWDRARGRRRCPRCWYPMEGVAANGRIVCPECGHGVADERGLRRTRRKWRWACVAAALGLGAYGLSITPRVLEQGWPSAIPSSVLVTVWPVSVKNWVGVHLDLQRVNDPVVEELDRRMDEGALADWQQSLWHDRVEKFLRKEGRFGIAREMVLLDKLKTKRGVLKIEAERLDEVLRRIGEHFGVPIEAEWAALEAEQLTPRTRVSLVSTTGVEALNSLVKNYSVDFLSGVGWRVEPGKVMFGVLDPMGAVLPVCSYELGVPGVRDDDAWTTQGDITPLEERLEQLQWVITQYIDPEEWVEHGGMSNTFIRVGSRSLVRAPARTHSEIASLLGAITRAMELPGGAASASDDWNEIASIHDVLVKTEMEFPDAHVSVEEFVDALRLATGVPIEADWTGLANVRVYRELPIKTAPAKLSAAAALDHYIIGLVAEPLATASWTIHNGAVKIGKREDVDALRLVRCYNVEDCAPSEELKEQLEREIMRGVDPDGWIAGGGETGWMSIVGPLLVVENHSRNQLAIEKLLERRRLLPGQP